MSEPKPKRSRSFVVGSTKITINVVPFAFLLFVVIAVIAIVFFAPAETAEVALTPAGILALVAQAAMRQAFQLERLDGEPEPAKPSSDEGKPEP